MGNLITAKVNIRGVRPLWQHRFGPDALPLEKREKTGVAGHDPQEWRRTCMITQDGQLYVDGSYIFGAMRQAGIYTKSGRATIQKSLVATLQVMTDLVLLDRWYPGFPNGHGFDVETVEPCKGDLTQPVYIDCRGVVNPSTKGRNVRYRLACSPGWQCEFDILWDKTIVDRTSMQAVVIDAGRLVGLGSGRSIGMGRFEMTSFEVQDA